VFGKGIGSPLFQVPAGGGPVTPATSLDDGKSMATHAAPQFLPDGRHFPSRQWSDNRRSVLGSLDSKNIKVLFHSNSSGVRRQAICCSAANRR
jgi:hypothetical protein